MNSTKFLNSYMPNSKGASPAAPIVNGLNNAFKSVRNTASSMGNTVSNMGGTMGNTLSNVGNTVASSTGGILPGGMIIVAVLGLIVMVVVFVFYDKIKGWSEDVINFIKSGGKMSEPEAPPPPPPVVTAPPTNVEQPATPAGAVEAILPGKKEVFNVSSNRFTYGDAEPLCRALGAELATYDQVKAAFDSGADWCNYGWTKGQLALYPTQKETYEKMQAGPEGQRTACGKPGLNGGHFDNPELRFGVNCYGNKPAQSAHDASKTTKGAPISPDALAFDKLVAKFKSDSDNIGIMPFNEEHWSN